MTRFEKRNNIRTQHKCSDKQKKLTISEKNLLSIVTNNSFVRNPVRRNTMGFLKKLVGMSLPKRDIHT